MEPKFQTSFIPKKPIGSAQGTSVTVIRSTNFFSVAATVIFIVTILVSGGLFFYKKVLINQIDLADKEIIKASAAYEPEKIQELIDVNNRIISAKKLLDSHVVVSKALKLMEDLTLRKMRFLELNYALKGNIPTLTITGEVQTYNALAEQQNVFLNNENIKNPVFSNFNLADNGYILVSFSANIDPNYISYKNAINAIPLN